MIEVTCAIIVEKEHVLVTQRGESMPHALKWEFPGGKVNEGETPQSCIRREIREELGVEIRVDRLLQATEYRYETHTVKLIPCICKILKGSIVLAEHKSYRWVPLNDLGDLEWLDADVEVARMLKESTPH